MSDDKKIDNKPGSTCVATSSYYTIVGVAVVTAVAFLLLGIYNLYVIRKKVEKDGKLGKSDTTSIRNFNIGGMVTAMVLLLITIAIVVFYRKDEYTLGALGGFEQQAANIQEALRTGAGLGGIEGTSGNKYSF